MKYRKKPVVIEAIQYNGNMNPVWDLFGASVIYGIGNTKYGTPYIETLEGDMHISDGDYIIKGVQGELYPCKPDIFEKTYEAFNMPTVKQLPGQLDIKVEANKHGKK